MSNISRPKSKRYAAACLNSEENDKDLNSFSDINSQFHIVKSEDFKRNKLSEEFDSNNDQNRENSSDISEVNSEYTSDYHRQSKKYQWKTKCPTCFGYNKRGHYYCSECINGGNFYHSSFRNPERYADKRLREKQLRMQSSSFVKKLHTECPEWLKREKLINEIEELREKNKMIRKVIDQKRMETNNAVRQGNEIKCDIMYRKRTCQGFKKKNVNLQENVNLYNERIPRKYEMISHYEMEYQMFVKEHIRELTTLIFPFTRISPDESSEGTVKDLADASQTHYVQGKWVKVPNNNSQFCKYSILSTVLPGSGNYGSSIRIEDDDDDAKSEVSKEEVNNIFAGLSFLAQLVNIIACYVNVYLPKKVSPSDFSSFSIDEKENKKFLTLVYRLNANMFYLCMSQGVPPSSLHPSRALPNLMALVTGENKLGRFGPFEFPEAFNRYLLEGTEQPDLFPDSDSDGEWETVNPATVPDACTISSSHRQSPFEDMLRQGLVTSAASSVLSYFWDRNPSS